MTNIRPHHFVVRTEAGFLGARTLGRLEPDLPEPFSYSYVTAGDAEEAARVAGLTKFRIVPVR